MSLFDKIFNSLFSTNKKVEVREILRRPERYLAAYREWLKGPQVEVLRKDLSRSWSSHLNRIKPPVDITIYTSDGANGLMVFPQYRQEKIPLSYLMEYIKDRMLDIKYRLVHSERTVYEKGAAIETLEKYYLKPSLSTSEPFDQIYGNVQLELLIHDQEEVRLKVLVTIYSDRAYTKPRDFEAFLSFLFDN